MTKTTTTFTRADALTAVPALAAIDRLVAALVAGAPTDQPFCASCVWEDILKPLATPALGWGRGYAADPATTGSNWLSRADLIAVAGDEPSPATSDLERWLRTPDAWAAVTGSWLAGLHEVDPGLGHGYPRAVMS